MSDTEEKVFSLPPSFAGFTVRFNVCLSLPSPYTQLTPGAFIFHNNYDLITCEQTKENNNFRREMS